MTDNFLRKLAEECVSASYRSTDVEAASKLLGVETELLKHAGETAKSTTAQKTELAAV
jgi:hypothetical protein